MFNLWFNLIFVKTNTTKRFEQLNWARISFSLFIKILLIILSTVWCINRNTTDQLSSFLQFPNNPMIMSPLFWFSPKRVTGIYGLVILVRWHGNKRNWLSVLQYPYFCFLITHNTFLGCTLQHQKVNFTRRSPPNSHMLGNSTIHKTLNCQKGSFHQVFIYYLKPKQPSFLGLTPLSCNPNRSHSHLSQEWRIKGGRIKCN